MFTNKIFYVLVAIVSLFFISIGTENVSAQTDTDTVTLTTTIQGYINIEVTAGDPVAFGNLTPGTPICPATGVVTTTNTNAANGYTIGISDGGTSTASSMTHTDTTTKITDVTNSGTVAAPAVWGTSTGVGITLFAADTSKTTAQWGTGTTACDALNKYAAVPATATTAHTAAGAPKTNDTTSWGFKIDVPNTQKTGAYSGDVTFTATAVLS